MYRRDSFAGGRMGFLFFFHKMDYIDIDWLPIWYFPYRFSMEGLYFQIERLLNFNRIFLKSLLSFQLQSQTKVRSHTASGNQLKFSHKIVSRFINEIYIEYILAWKHAKTAHLTISLKSIDYKEFSIK